MKSMCIHISFYEFVLYNQILLLKTNSCWPVSKINLIIHNRSKAVVLNDLDIFIGLYLVEKATNPKCND